MKNTQSYPKPLATWSEKIKDAYGLQYAKAISQDWFDGGLISKGKGQYQNRKDYIRNNRMYVRAEQDIEEYKKLFATQDGDLSLVNLDWRPINTVQKFCRIVSNGIGDDNYKIGVRTNDRLSLKIKKDERNQHLKNMRALPLMKQAKELLGINTIPEGFIPKDEEDLALYDQLKEKPSIEIAEEIIIDYIKLTNNWVNIENNKNKDLTDNGICAVRIYTDGMDGVKLQAIDPEFLVHSYINTNDFSDAFYYGYIDTITLNDLKRESDFDDAKLRKIAAAYSSDYKMNYNYEKDNLTEILGEKVDVLRFCFKTSKTDVYKTRKRKGNVVKVSKKDESYDPPERSDYGRISGTKDTWMEGSWPINTEYVYDYGECENIIRDEQNKARPPFVVRATDIYENRLHSFLDDIKPLADELQRIHLKIQHLRSELKPDLVQIDLDQLAELSSEGNKEKNWKQALNILNVKGVVFTQRIDLGEMGIKEGSGARPIPTQQGTSLVPLLNMYAGYYNQIRDVTGVNSARDGSLPHDALLGVNQMAQLASNTATKHIVDAATDFNKRVAETISARIHRIYKNKNAKHLVKLYERAVGKQNIDALEALKDRHLHDFGFTIEMLPTRQELQELKEDLSLYLQSNSISPEIKSEAMRIAKVNIKLANQYLAYESKKLREQKRKEQEEMFTAKSQSDIAASSAASKNSAQVYAMKIQMDLKYQEGLAKIEVFKRQAIIAIESPKDDKEFRQEMYLESLKNASTINLRKFQEEAKDLRIDKQSTHQSKMIVERKSDNPQAIDFENNFDFMDL